jgi:hypothetical protein
MFANDGDHFFNPALMRLTQSAITKVAFVPGGDPSMGAGGDPSQGGGAPPDPSQGSGDPSGGGGAPPPDGGGGGGGGIDPGMVQSMVTTAVQQAMASQGGGAGGGGGMGAGGKNALTPKIDEKAVMLQILKILARVADFLGVKIPASEMVVTQSDMQGLASASASGGPMPGMDPSAGGGGAGGGGDPSGGAGGGAIGGIPPMDPMQGAGTPGPPGGAAKAGSYQGNGVAAEGMVAMGNKASAILAIQRHRERAA